LVGLTGSSAVRESVGKELRCRVSPLSVGRCQPLEAWTGNGRRETLWLINAGGWALLGFPLLPSSAAGVLCFTPQQPTPRLTRHGVFRYTAGLFPYPA